MDESGHFRVQVNNRRDCFGRRLNETGEFSTEPPSPRVGVPFPLPN